MWTAGLTGEIGLRYQTSQTQYGHRTGNATTQRQDKKEKKESKLNNLGVINTPIRGGLKGIPYNYESDGPVTFGFSRKQKGSLLSGSRYFQMIK